MTEDLLFNHEIDNLRSAGVELSDLTGEEIVALVRAVDRLRSPFSNVNADICGMPIEVRGCDVVLWKLTVGATVWLNEYAKKWWLDRGMRKAYFWAMVYALANARKPDAFVGLTKEQEAHEKIQALGLRLCVHEQEIADAVEIALEVRESQPKTGNPNVPEAPDQQTDWATVIARIEGQSGIPAEKWCWQRSADYVLRVHEDLKRFAELAAGGKPDRMRDENDMATSDLAKLRAAIVERVKASREGQA